ncbi:MAG: gliding motility protein GldM, partial [Bacteroidota bacterium]
ALNVQKEVLDAFVNVDEGLKKTIATFNSRNEVLYADFAEKAEVNPIKVGPLRKTALEVQEKANEIVDMIQEMKIKIVETSEGPAEDTEAIEEGHIHIARIGGKDNMDIPAQIMVGDNNDKEGKRLREAIEEFRGWLTTEVVDEEFEDLIASIERSLDTDTHEGPDGTQHPWEYANFSHLPLAGVIAIMSGIQTDVRNVESEVISYLHNQIDAGDFKFNKLEANVIPNSNYVIRGNEYRSEIFLAASDTTQTPIILLGNYEEKYNEELGRMEYEMVGRYDSVPIENGRGILTQRANTTGVKEYRGIIKIKNPDGSYTSKPFEQSYQVAEGSYGVNPLKMNVFYLGVDNPVDVFVSGVPSELVSASVTNGRLRRAGNNWIVNPASKGNALIEVFAEIDGQRKSQGYREFRVKEVPDPVAKVAGMKSGVINKSVLLAQLGVVADMENFDFDLEFKVTGFTVSAIIKGFSQDFPVKGNMFSDKQKNLIDNLNRGDKVYIENIRAIGPDGNERKLNTISFKLN